MKILDASKYSIVKVYSNTVVYFPIEMKQFSQRLIRLFTYVFDSNKQAQDILSQLS